MLRRILQNLLANALRYTAPWRRAGRRAPARRPCDGAGVRHRAGHPGSRREAIFQEFNASTAHPARRGFGLGLAIVRRFAQALDHPVSLASNVGRGSTFPSRLPRAEPAPKAFLAPPPLMRLFHSPVAGAKILLIENEPSVSEAMVTLLERWGCDVAVAGSGNEALERLRTLPTAPQHRHRRSAPQQRRARHCDASMRVRRARVGQFPRCIVTADHSVKAEEEVRAAGLEMLRKPVAGGECGRCWRFC